MIKNLVGVVFGRWVVVSRSMDYVYPSTGKHSARWECKCECGVIKIVHGAHLKNGSSTSCGCYNRELSTTHGKSHTREYASWNNMHRRCSGKSSRLADVSYLDKKIIICDEWVSFDAFYVDMGVCPDGYELERINGDIGYSKNNCCWASEQRQSENRGTFSNNTSGKSGVVWSAPHQKWRVSLNKNKVRHSGGLHAEFSDAVVARENLELIHLGYVK